MNYESKVANELSVELPSIQAPQRSWKLSEIDINKSFRKVTAKICFPLFISFPLWNTLLINSFTIEWVLLHTIKHTTSHSSIAQKLFFFGGGEIETAEKNNMSWKIYAKQAHMSLRRFAKEHSKRLASTGPAIAFMCAAVCNIEQ